MRTNNNTTNNTKATANTNVDMKAIMTEIVNNDEIMEIIIKAAKKAAKKDKLSKKGFRKELKKLTIGDVKLELSALNNNTITFKTGDININVASDWKNDMPITSHILSDIESQMKGNLTLEDNSKSSNIRK